MKYHNEMELMNNEKILVQFLGELLLYFSAPIGQNLYVIYTSIRAAMSLCCDMSIGERPASSRLSHISHIVKLEINGG